MALSESLGHQERHRRWGGGEGRWVGPNTAGRGVALTTLELRVAKETHGVCADLLRAWAGLQDGHRPPPHSTEPLNLARQRRLSWG